MRRLRSAEGLVILALAPLTLFACQLFNGQEPSIDILPTDTPETAETATNEPPTPTIAPTSTPTAEPTEQPPTHTPEATASGDSATPSEPNRINFPSGATSTTVDGNLSWPDRDMYVFRALASQQARIDITSAGQVANFALVGLEDGQPYKRVENEDRFWAGTFPHSQDYELTVALPGSGEGVDYTVTLVIEPLTDVPLVNNPGSPPADTCIAAHPGAGPAVDVLAGPGEQFALQAYLSNWAEVLASELGWYMILIGPTEVGWVKADTVVLAGPCAESAGEPYLVTNEEVPVYAGPDTSFDILQTLPAGQKLTLLGHNADSTWWAIPGPGPGPSLHGWVAAGQVTVHGDISGLPVLPLSETGAPVIQNPGLPPLDSCVAAHLGLGPAVKVYADAVAESAVVAELGNWAVVLETAGDWHRIITGPDQSGWVANEAVVLNGPCG